MEEEIFLDDFSAPREKESLEIMARAFEVDINTFEKLKFVVAQYCYENWEGSSFVLFYKDEDLFENYGSHCSCYGLEGQWAPQETSIEAIKLRLDSDYRFTPKIKAILKAL